MPVFGIGGCTTNSDCGSNGVCDNGTCVYSAEICFKAYGCPSGTKVHTWYGWLPYEKETNNGEVICLPVPTVCEWKECSIAMNCTDWKSGYGIYLSDVPVTYSIDKTFYKNEEVWVSGIMKIGGKILVKFGL